jgi:hypothetical protein
VKIVRSLIGQTQPKPAADEARSTPTTEPVEQKQRAWAQAPVDGAADARPAAPQVKQGPGKSSATPVGAATGALALRTMQMTGKDATGGGARLSALTRGRPFDVDAAAIEKVCGAPLTRAGLTELYADCLPGTTPAITGASSDGKSFEYMVSWFDNDGQEVARAGREMKRQEDGSVEMHVHTVWTSPDVRGRGVSAKAMLAEIDMLRAVSDHDRTCMSLRAGGMPDVNKGKNAATERVGSYAWANFGYDFADAHDKKPFFFYGDRVEAEADDRSLRELSALQLMQRGFTSFVDEQIEAGALPKDPAVREALLEAAQAWKKPWDVSTFHVDGLTIDTEIGGKNVPFHLGKAFLTSEHSVNWDAVYFVNGDAAGRGVQEAYCQRAVDKCDRAEEKTRARWMEGLASDDRSTRVQTYRAIGSFGDDSWREALARTKKRFPRDARLIDDALQGTARQGQAERQASRALDKGTPARSKQIALEAAIELKGGETDWDLLTKMMSSRDGATAWAGAQTLFARELDRDPDRCAKLVGKCGDPEWVCKNACSEGQLQKLIDTTTVLSKTGRAARRAMKAAVKEREEQAARLDALQADIARVRESFDAGEPEQRDVDPSEVDDIEPVQRPQIEEAES